MPLFRPRSKRPLIYRLPRRKRELPAQAYKNVVQWTEHLNNLYGVAKEIAALPRSEASLEDTKSELQRQKLEWERRLARGKTFKARQAARGRIAEFEVKFKQVDVSIGNLSIHENLLVAEAQERIKTMHALDVQARHSPDWTSILAERKVIADPLGATNIHGIVTHVFAAAEPAVRTKITGVSSAIGPKKIKYS